MNKPRKPRDHGAELQALMIRQVDHSRFGEFTPVAKIAVPNESCPQKELKCAPNVDDWGGHCIAAFQQNDRVFAVVQ